MKKIILVAFVFSSISFISCKSEKKETIKQEISEKKATFSLQDAANNIEFTAYKTTAKVGVKGNFQKVNILTGGEGNTIKEALHNTTFSIPVSSLFTKDSSRDYKIKKFFFGIMEETLLLSGKLTLENDSTGIATLTMNKKSRTLPFSYTIKGKEFAMTATMNIDNWSAQKALASLNTACIDLHKGADGVSKTWSEVALNISSTFK